MSTLNVTLPEGLHQEIVMLAAHDGVTPSEFVAAAAAEKVQEVADKSEFGELGPGGYTDDAPRTHTIIPLPDMGVNVHDHLTPYRHG